MGYELVSPGSSGRVKGSGHPSLAGLDGARRPFPKVSLLNLFFSIPFGRCWKQGQISDPHRDIFPRFHSRKGRLFRP